MNSFYKPRSPNPLMESTIDIESEIAMISTGHRESRGPSSQVPSSLMRAVPEPLTDSELDEITNPEKNPLMRPVLEPRDSERAKLPDPKHPLRTVIHFQPPRRNELLTGVYEPQPITINVGGTEFTAYRNTFERSPVLKSALQLERFINRSPKVFGNILDWLRTGKVYNDCDYDRLLDDAKFYQLDDLVEFLSNRFNLHKFVYLKGTDCTCLFNLEEFRMLESEGGYLDRMVAGKTNDCVYLMAGNKIPINARLEPYRDILLNPLHHYPAIGDAEEARFLFGARIVVEDSGPAYIPKWKQWGQFV